MPGISKTKRYTADMITGPVFVPFIRYTLPVVFAGILSLLFNTADTIVVGQFVGESAVAAVGSTSALIGFIINFFLGISMGATVKLATDLGAGEKNLGRTVKTAYTLGIIVGLLTCVIGVSLAENMLIWMNTQNEILTDAVLYLRIYFLGQPAFMIFSFGRAVLSAYGETKAPLYYLTASGIVNVLLNLFFVIVCRQGVAGVAIATAISQVLSAVLITRKMMQMKELEDFSVKKLVLDRNAMGRIMRLGIPAGLQTALFVMSTVLIQSAANSLQSTALVAGNTAAANIEAYIYQAMISIAQACQAYSGQNYGAGNTERLKKVYKISILLEVTVGAVLGAIACFSGEGLLAMFLPDSPEGIQFGLVRLHIIGLIYFLCGIMDCTSYMLRGMNRTIVPLIITLTGSVLFRIIWIATVFVWARASFDAARAYWILLASYPVSWIITFLVLLLYFFKTIHVIEKQAGKGVFM